MQINQILLEYTRAVTVKNYAQRILNRIPGDHSAVDFLKSYMTNLKLKDLTDEQRVEFIIIHIEEYGDTSFLVPLHYYARDIIKGHGQR